MLSTKTPTACMEPEFLTDEVITEAFMTRFGMEIRPRAELAREKLHQNKIRMSKEGSEGLLPYIGIFRDVVRDVPDVSPGDQVAWFQRGLSPTLQVECITDYKGSKFLT